MLGGQDLVHLVGEGAGRTVESLGGKYFTGPTAPTTPSVSDGVLRGPALDSLTDRGAGRGPRRRAAAGSSCRAAAGGARRFIGRATDPATGAPLVREVLVDAVHGVVALATARFGAR
ncbi:hypothetical protein [Kitasatospora purpeofusca]|uniref:hypothetical protein n=1 Tax=Kitasatospora purpeofusca TaxID=67352 RepID=UPI002A5A746D|nr:hypothetical protein [Kitasatospora purpeofusca]MDY0816843.1 hypothetical protein [Kitasatospora purpeofusca]